MFVATQSTSGWAYRMPRGDSEMRFYRDFDYAVDWCVENFGRSGERWCVSGDTIAFATPQDAAHFEQQWVETNRNLSSRNSG